MNGSEIELLPEDANGFVTSWVGLGGLVAVLCLAAVVMLGRAARTWTRLARAQAARSGALAPGRTATLVGVVELAPSDADASPPIVADVTQRPVASGKAFGQRVVWWSGRLGGVRARPFVLRLPTGDAVPIEPGPDVTLADDLDDVVSVSRDERIRRAAIEPGEEVCVVGLADARSAPGAGYRGGGSELVLRAPRGGKLLVTSQAHLPKALRAVRDLAAFGLVPILAALAFLLVPIGGELVALTTRGEVLTAPVLRFDVERYRRKGRTLSNAFVVARHPSGGELQARIGDDDFLALAQDPNGSGSTFQPRRPLQVAFVVDPASPTARHQLGRRPYVAAMDLVLGALATGLALAAVGALGRRLRPWYEGGEVRESQALDGA